MPPQRATPPGIDHCPLHPDGGQAPRPLSHPARVEAEAGWAELVSALHRRRPRARGWRVPRRPTFDPSQRYGPLTPLVAARGAQLLEADEVMLGTLVDAAARLEAAGLLGSSRVDAHALAHRVGRTQRLVALESAVDVLVQTVSGQETWEATVLALLGPVPEELAAQAEYVRARARLVELLRAVAADCLTTLAVWDVADRGLRRRAIGGWEAAVHPEGLSGLAAWHAPTPVVDVLRRVLRSRSAASLNRIGLLHQATLDGAPFHPQAGRYAALETRLTAWALTSAAAAPPVGRLLAGTRAGDQLQADELDLGDSRLRALQGWATCLTSLLTHRDRLGADDVEVFCWPFRSVLPGLRRLVTQPV